MLFLFQDTVDDIIDKKVKEEMVSWYLSLIERRVGEYLETKGFVCDALPFNYIDNCPKDLNLVKKNLSLCIYANVSISYLFYTLCCVYFVGIVSSELSEKNRNELDKNVIIPLKERIYRVLDEHCTSVRTLLWFHNKVEKVKELCDDGFRRELEMDVEYIEEMKRKDDDPSRTEKPHIVGVSGLVMNTLLRIENEHATVLKHWNYY